MMICPESYVLCMKDLSYQELIKKRDSLIRKVRKLEKIVMNKDLSDEAWQFDPDPEVQYQVYLQYLSELCTYMHERYNAEFVWGENDFSRG